MNNKKKHKIKNLCFFLKINIQKTKHYWTYLEKLKKENSQVVSATTHLKLLASDGKKHLIYMLAYAGIITLARTKSNRFIDFMTLQEKSEPKIFQMVA